MIEETPQEVTQAEESAIETTQPKEDLVPRSQYTGLQRRLTQKDREIQDLRSRMVTLDHLEARDKKLFDALELVLPEDEDERPASRRERLRQLRTTEQSTPSAAKKPDVDPVFQLTVQQVTKTAEKLGIKQGTKEWDDLLTGEDGDYRDPVEVLDDLNSRIIAQKVKEQMAADRVEAAQKVKASGATRPDGAPSASGSPQPVQPGDWARAKATAKTPQELIKQFQGRV